MAARPSLARRLSQGQLSTAGALQWLRAGLRAHQMLVALVGCYLAIGFTASLLIQPWQSPDEPTHFEYARGVALGTTEETPAIQAPIIASFYRYRFWEYRGASTPKVAPDSFGAMSRLLIRQVDKTPLYYWLAASAASWTDDVTLQLYSMRWLSVLLSAATIPIAYAIARETLPEARAPLALVAAALVAFLPMYGFIGASVNPDTIGAPLAAAATWLAVRGLRGKRPAIMLPCAVLVALLAFWSRRSSIALIPWALLVAGAWSAGLAWRRLPRIAAVAAGVAVIAVFVGVAAWPSGLAAAWLPLGGQLGSTRSDRYAYAGGASLRLAHQQPAPPALLWQRLTAPQLRILNGRDVVVQAMVRSGAGMAPGRLALTLQSDTAHATSAAFVATPDWQIVALPVALPKVSLFADITIELDGDGELYADRVQLIDPASGLTLVTPSNAGGEAPLWWWQARFPNNRVVAYLTRIIQSVRDGLYISPAALALYPYFIGQMFDSLIGHFGWMSVGSNSLLIAGMGAIWLALLIALVGVFRRTSGFDAGRRRALAGTLVLVLMAIATLLLEYTTYLYAPTFPQGRYLFPVLAGLAALLVSGLAQLLPARHDRAGAALLILLLLALDVWSWAGVIVPFFYG